MQPRMRYGDFLSAVRHGQRVLRYPDVAAADRAMATRPRLRWVDIHRLVTPYFGVRFAEQLRAVVPLALMLALFLVVVLRAEITDAQGIALGMLAVVLGLMFFMEGVKHGLMPFAENIGYTLPGRRGRTAVLAVAFVLGAAATLAEPAIGALRTAGRDAGTAAPVLTLLLGTHAHWLVLSVALGVACAVALGMLRFFLRWNLKPVLMVTLALALGLTWHVGTDPALAPVLGLAWDSGAITTGPVTVPLVLAIGIGVAAASASADNPLSGFGIVTLASLLPAIAVMLLAIWVGGDALAPALPTAAAPATRAWHEITPLPEVLGAARAILPLVAFLWVVQRLLLREPLHGPATIVYGLGLALAGMILFNIGLTLGLVALGDQAGAMSSAAFSAGSDGQGPLYPYALGLALTLAFAAFVGYGATVAEPALNAMGITVQELTDGALSRPLLVHTVGFGVAAGTALGVAKIVFQIPMIALLLPAYGIAIALTAFSSEEYVNLAWDSAGVTTGPVTVPLVLSLGLGLGEAVGAAEGFGILSMASVGPIVSVLTVGLAIRWRLYLRTRRERTR